MVSKIRSNFTEPVIVNIRVSKKSRPNDVLNYDRNEHYLLVCSSKISLLTVISPNTPVRGSRGRDCGVHFNLVSFLKITDSFY